MSGDTRFRKGQSGNPRGRLKQRRPHVSAFDIMFDKILTVTQSGRERELTINEALQLQTYQDALKASRMAVRKVLKMIEKLEVALAKKDTSPRAPVTVSRHHHADNADAAMRILGIIERDPKWDDEHPRDRVGTLATQAVLSRSGRKKFDQREIDDIKKFTIDVDKLKWPRGRVA